MLVLVDTNVLLRAADQTHAHYALATSGMRACLEAGHDLCVVPQIHYEFWAVATRPAAKNGLGMTTAEAETMLRKLGPPIFGLLRDERAIYDVWCELVTRHQVQGKNAHDARLVAAMRRHGITHLLTFNVADFRRFQDVILVDPANDLSIP